LRVRYPSAKPAKKQIGCLAKLELAAVPRDQPSVFEHPGSHALIREGSDERNPRFGDPIESIGPRVPDALQELDGGPLLRFVLRKCAISASTTLMLPGLPVQECVSNC